MARLPSIHARCIAPPEVVPVAQTPEFTRSPFILHAERRQPLAEFKIYSVCTHVDIQALCCLQVCGPNRVILCPVVSHCRCSLLGSCARRFGHHARNGLIPNATKDGRCECADDCAGQFYVVLEASAAFATVCPQKCLFEGSVPAHYRAAHLCARGRHYRREKALRSMSSYLYVVASDSLLGAAVALRSRFKNQTRSHASIALLVVGEAVACVGLACGSEVRSDGASLHSFRSVPARSLRCGPCMILLIDAQALVAHRMPIIVQRWLGRRCWFSGPYLIDAVSRSMCATCCGLERARGLCTCSTYIRLEASIVISGTHRHFWGGRRGVAPPPTW